MTIDRSKSLVSLLFALALLISACGSDSEKSADATDGSGATAERDFTGDRAEDKKEIQELFDELLARVRELDYGVLYDNEFAYLKDSYSYDDYLRFDQLKSFAFDTVQAINVVEYEFMGEDTCKVTIEAVFRNAPPGDDRRTNQALVYHHEGRWIKPTISGVGNGPQLQRKFERTVFEAESAAAAEAAEGL